QPSGDVSSGHEADIAKQARVCPLLEDTVEKGFWGRSLSNIDSRSNATAQSRFKNPFVRIRLFQILIPQLHFGDFFNSIRAKRTWHERGLARTNSLITMAGATGLESATFGVTGRQLNLSFQGTFRLFRRHSRNILDG